MSTIYTGLLARQPLIDLPAAAFTGAGVAKFAALLELLHDALHMAGGHVQRIRELAGR